MRTLKFIVDGQIIKPDPDCDFDNLVPGSGEIVKAEFFFSSAWEGCAKVAAFNSPLGKEYPPQVLKDGYSCTIPADALKKRSFKICVLGKKRTDTKIETFKTNKLAVSQNGGKA